MNAFHSNWTKPFFSKNKEREYYIEDYELLTTIISALKWKEKNGSIKMITDKIGASYYNELGIEHIWNLGIETTLEEYIDSEIDPFLFWAAGKIFSLNSQDTPCIMMDTDFIVWESIGRFLKDNKFVVIHREAINNSIYPDKDSFNMNKSYEFSLDWDWSILPCNTALTYIADEKFKNYYVEKSVEFMNNLKNSSNPITNMVFAEQRVIAMCAKEHEIEIKSLLNLVNNDIFSQKYFTHVWGYKRIMQSDFSKRKSFCIKCICRILKDFPEEIETLSKIKSLSLYFEEAVKLV